jgi:ACS family glucarate transporter-like MFS transporter
VRTAGHVATGEVSDVRGTVVRILPSLWGFAFLSYLLRTNIAVAQQYMARELTLSDIQVGYIFGAFLTGYTLFQVPTGIWGDKFGPRVVLTASALICSATTLLTGFTPGKAAGSAFFSLAWLLICRFVLGLGQAATYPVAMTAVADWFPERGHALFNAVIFTGSTLGAAFAPPLVAHIMNALGWRATFYWTGTLPILLAIYWWSRTKGRSHRAIRHHADRQAGSWHLIGQPDLLLLCLSYFLYCYTISIFVYWLFKYLVDVRHLSIVNSGWATGLPWIAATAAVPISGHLSDRLSRRIGALNARRNIASVCLVVSAVLVFVGAGTKTIAVAIAAIAASVALLFCTEASYWSTSIAVAKGEAGKAGGLMNFAGNLGGVVSTLLVPVLAHAFGWFVALFSGSVCALLATFFWFLIRPIAAEVPDLEF